MVTCVGMEYDYPLRVKSLSGGVIHAAKIRRFSSGCSTTRYNPRTEKFEAVEEIPDRDVAVTACKPYAEKSYVRVDSSEEITCKNCLRKLTGYEDVKKDVFRYVLQEKASDCFYKKMGWKNAWVKDFGRATMYYTAASAEKKGKRSFYLHNRTGEEFTPQQYQALTREEKQWCRYKTVVDKERYVVKKIKLELV